MGCMEATCGALIGAVMAAGAILSGLLTAWAGGAAFLVWAVLFFPTVRLDARAAFAKYLR